jgi:hypothetical protein
VGGEVGVSFGWIVGSLWIAMAKAEVTVLKNASIVTMDGEMRVYVGNGAMVVEGENIVAIGKTEDVLRVYESKADTVLDLSSRWILPGIPHLMLLHSTFPCFLLWFFWHSLEWG